MAQIFILGASGYVGKELVKLLQTSNHQLTVLDRGNAKLHLEKYNVEFAPGELLTSKNFDVVINLAYPNVGAVYFSKNNREIFHLIHSCVRSHTKIIHISTQAVFGLALDYPIRLSQVQQRRDYPYVQAKIELENILFNKYSQKNNLTILRLGNVWGPASQTWTCTIANKLLFGKAVGVDGRDGYSNITDVANTTSYIQFLAEKYNGSQIFHHLAELGNHRWSEMILPMSKRLGVPPLYERMHIPASPSYYGDFKNVFSEISFLQLCKRIALTRTTGAIIRSAMSSIPIAVFEKSKRKFASKISSGHELSDEEKTFLSIMSTPVQFASSVSKDWIQPISMNDSINNVLQWMEEAGYFENFYIQKV
jgi:nucleoside-diphosphate-sugar epimerase